MVIPDFGLFAIQESLGEFDPRSHPRLGKICLFVVVGSSEGPGWLFLLSLGVEPGPTLGGDEVGWNQEGKELDH
jgi:hypothetical protein